MSGIGSEGIPVEIIRTVVGKRWTAVQKLRMVEESMQPSNSISPIVRQNVVSPAIC